MLVLVIIFEKSLLNNKSKHFLPKLIIYYIEFPWTSPPPTISPLSLFPRITDFDKAHMDNARGIARFQLEKWICLWSSCFCVLLKLRGGLQYSWIPDPINTFQYWMPPPEIYLFRKKLFFTKLWNKNYL